MVIVVNLIHWDEALFLLINGGVGKSLIVDGFIKLIVNEYFVPVTLALIIVYLWFRPRNEKKLDYTGCIVSLLSVGVINLTIKIGNYFILRPRPFDVIHTNLLYYKPTDPSFPSNATAVGFSIATAIFIADRTLGTFALSLSALYGFSRIYSGIHFPSDVIVGALLGIFCTVIVSKFEKIIYYLSRLLLRILSLF